ncbi:hypothetical protein [Desulfosarcina ovata]|nr:hypothetical protein [Desulfosarcina ovata]
MAVMNRMHPLSRLWHKLGSIHLTVGVCLALTADLAVGYACLNRKTFIFQPLNDIGLASWIQTYGRHHFIHTAWFFILLGLLTLLAINTLVCTTQRMVWLVARRRHFRWYRFVFKLAPHIMHYALIVILTGYLCSYLFAQVLDVRTLIPGVAISLPGNSSARIVMTDFEPVYYEADRLPAFKGRVLSPRAILQLIDASGQRRAVLTATRPLRFNGYGIFLKDFSPKKKDGGMNRCVRVDITIRNDPGVRLYLAGILLFSLGLAMYLMERFIPN